MDGDMHIARGLPDAHGNNGLFVGILDSVIDEIAQSLLESAIIPITYEGFGGRFDGKLVIGSDGTQLFYDFFDQDHDIAGTTRESKPAARQACTLEEIEYEP